MKVFCVGNQRIFRTVLFSSLLFMFFCILWSPASGEERIDSARPKIGLVLGGGGAKGAAHIGVLRVLEELKIPVDYIAGTSMGAIVGALYASGLTAEELESVLTSIDWKDVFSGDPDRQDIDWRRKREDYQILTGLALGVKDGKVVMPRGLIKDQKVNVLFETLMLHTADIDDFDNLPIPYRAVAADLETGEMVVLKNGRLADAARASMSVPGAFPPIELGGRYLIDGGIVRNVPVDIVREMGADIVICVDVGKPLATRNGLTDPVSIMNQMIDIMMKKNVEVQIKTLGEQDVYINPQLGELSSGDFDKSAEISRLGEEAARAKEELLKRYSVSEDAYAAFTAKHHREQEMEVRIAAVNIEIEGESGISKEYVASRLETQAGDTVGIEELKRDAGRVYGMGDFERVDLFVKKKDDEHELLVKAKEKSWGPNYLRFGIGFESTSEGDSRYNVLFDYTRRWINRLGAEWKTQLNLGFVTGIYTEFYQPLSVSRLFFVSPMIQWRRELYDVYDDDDKAASFYVTRYEGGLDLGFQPWMYGEARVGVRFGTYNLKQETGDLDLTRDSITRNAIVANVRIDQLDNINFPNKGYLGRISSASSLDALGSDDEYNKVEGNVVVAFTFRRQTILAGLEAGSRVGNDLPAYNEFRMGGFRNFSGTHSGQLSGQSMALGRLISYHKVGQTIIGDVYLGGSLESGNVWRKDEKQFDLTNLRLAGSLFLGYDTIFGPLYIAYGHADGGYDAGYFYLGRPF